MNIEINDIISIKSELEAFRVYNIQDGVYFIHRRLDKDYKLEVHKEDIRKVYEQNNVEIGDTVILKNGVRAWWVEDIKDNIYYLEERWLYTLDDPDTFEVNLNCIDYIYQKVTK